MAEVQRKNDEFSEAFNLDCLRVTPNALYYDPSRPNVLRGRGRRPVKKDYGGGGGIDLPNPKLPVPAPTLLQAVVEEPEYGSEVEIESESEDETSPVKDFFEQQLQADMEQAKENLISFGFDKDVANAWFADKS